MKISYRTIGVAVVSMWLVLETGCAVQNGRLVFDPGALTGNPPSADYQFQQQKQKAEQGDARAQLTLGTYYAIGRGVPKDPMEAVKWYHLSAEQGYAPAQYRLGFCYAIGIGVARDYTEAVKWYRLSADQGNALAQNNLGRCFYFGHGVAQDYAEAEKWYRKAAAQGNLAAQRSLHLYSFERSPGGAVKPVPQDNAIAQNQPPLTVDDIKDAASSGVKADKIIAMIKETSSKFSQQDIDAAQQANPPVDPDVIKCMKDNLR